MIRKLVSVVVVLGVGAWLPAIAPGETLTADQQLAADELDLDLAQPRYPLASDGGYSYSYSDPGQVSAACVTSATPLDCTAAEGADAAAADISAESITPELSITDGAVVDTSALDSPAVLDASVSSSFDTTLSSSTDLSTSSLATSDATVSDAYLDPAAIDASGSIDPMIADTSASVDMSVAEVAATVRSMERGFNSRQEADYVGQTDPDGTSRLVNAVNQMAATGIRVHRLAVYWWDVQCRGAGVWDWAKYDAVVNAFNARGIRVILTPVGSPNWARVAIRRTPTEPGNPCRNTDARGLGPFAHPDNYPAWSVFIRQLALHYRASNALGYEIWNEENSRDFWDAVGNPDRPASMYQAPSPSLWAALYCRAVRQIDVSDPGKLAGVGGLAVHTRNRNDANGRLQDMRSSAFLQAAYTARSKRCPNTSTHSYSFDFVGYHPYAFSSYYNGANPAIGNTPAMVELRAVRGVMRARGQGRRKIWNTEWGFPSAWRGITEARQADLIRREHNYLANAHDAYGFYIRFSIYFNAFDEPQNSNVFSTIGVVHAPPDYTHKPSYIVWSGLP
jgi:Cellulase (glycosyl hydrolase family 5)